MSLSVLEVLMNAKHNLENAVMPVQIEIGKEQLRNAIAQLENDSDASKVFIENK